MSDQQMLKLDILRPAHGGSCIAFNQDGRPVFVTHTLPGETVRARVYRERAGAIYAEAVEILAASAHRRPQVWDQAGPGGVGGAQLGHVSEHFQRQWKAEVIADQLRRIGGVSTWQAVSDICEGGQVQVRPARGECNPALHWRTRIECMVSERQRLAMRRPSSHELIELTDMPLAHPEILALPIFGDSPLKDLWHSGQRVRLLAPNADGVRILIGKSVYGAHGGRAKEKVNWQVTADGLNGNFRVDAGGFWQIHRSAPTDLVEAVLAGANPRRGQRVLELYSGAGLLSYFLAQRIGAEGQLVTLEGGEVAVRDAHRNLASVAAPVRVLQGGVSARSVAAAAHEFDRAVDLVVLDPPRVGAGQAVCRAVTEMEPETIVLVSCDPAAGARDLASLIAGGYQMGRFEALDLFPQTHHVEIVATLRRRHGATNAQQR